MSPCMGVACIQQQNIVPIVSQRSLCWDQGQPARYKIVPIAGIKVSQHCTVLAVSHLLQVVETGQECLSGGYVDLNPGTASTVTSTGSQQVSSY